MIQVVLSPRVSRVSPVFLGRSEKNGLGYRGNIGN
jgi:hypothetical protein